MAVEGLPHHEKVGRYEYKPFPTALNNGSDPSLFYIPSDTMTSQLVTLNTPGLKWWLDHLDEQFDPDGSVNLFIG